MNLFSFRQREKTIFVASYTFIYNKLFVKHHVDNQLSRGEKKFIKKAETVRTGKKHFHLTFAMKTFE